MHDKKVDFVLVGGPFVEADDEQHVQLVCDMATEVGIHAAQQAIEAMTRVCNTLPIEARMPALAIAVAHLGWKLPAVTRETDAIRPGFEQAVKDLTAVQETALGNDFRRYAERTRRRYGL